MSKAGAVLFAGTPSLHLAYEQSGPADGDVLLLLHGFPYDVRQWTRCGRGLRRMVCG